MHRKIWDQCRFDITLLLVRKVTAGLKYAALLVKDTPTDAKPKFHMVIYIVQLTFFVNIISEHFVEPQG